MPRQKRDSEYNSQNSSNRYNKDSLDHYNEDLSKKAVGSIFSNIERGVSKEEDSQKDEIVVNTDFEVKNNSVRKELVGQFFNDADESADSKRRPKQVREPKRPASQGGRPQSNANSALVRDDDTISAKYVTRGNHQPITTPAMAARRKNVTMMESQRMPVITDAEINEYKKNNTEKTFAYVNSDSKKTTPIDYDNYIKSNGVTSEQKEIIELLKNEVTQREQNLENTLHRLNEKNKHYQEIIDSTNKRLNHASNSGKSNDLNTFDTFEEFEEFEGFEGFEEFNDFEDEIISSKDQSNAFEENIDLENDDFDVDDNIFFGDVLIDDSDINLTAEDLDKDFEETVATNSRSKQSKPFIPTKNLQETQSRIHTKTLLMPETDSDFYDLETDTYFTQKSKYSTGEVKKINDTIATEISIDELDEFVFDNYDTADMEYLRKTIKEKTKAQKMQNIDNKIHEFERTHRDFGGKQNIPPKTTPKQRHVQQEQPKQEQYEYKKSRQRVDKQTSYDTAPHRNASYDTASRRNASYDTLPDYDTSSFKRDYDTSSLKSIYDTDSHEAKYDSGSYNTGRVSSATGRVASTRTSRISTVDLENDIDIEDYSTKFNVSLIINIILAVAFAIVATLMFMKNSSITTITEELDATKTELLNQSNTITELQVELDYYKSLYLSTEEGKLSLEQDANGETTEGEDSAEGTSTGDEKTYTVQTGDTLSSISREFYGNSSEYQKIIDANGLTSDSLTLGQVLIIPN